MCSGAPGEPCKLTERPEMILGEVEEDMVISVMFTREVSAQRGAKIPVRISRGFE